MTTPAISLLLAAAEACETNAPIHDAEGDAEQAALCRANALSYRWAAEALRFGIDPGPGPDAVDMLVAAHSLAGRARAAGLVLTISQRPLQPLAMGHHADVVDVREVRNSAASDPGGCECNECGAIFIGGPEHSICGACAAAYEEAMRQEERRAEWHAEMRRDAFGTASSL